MKKSKTQKVLSTILLYLLPLSFLSYVIVSYDFVKTYEILVGILLFFSSLGSIIVFFALAGSILKDRKLPNRLTLIFLSVVILSYMTIYCERNGKFKGKEIINGAFLDERSRIDMSLYENGEFIIFSNWMFGEERFQGNYKIEGDTVTFENYPVIDNNFIAKKIIIDREESRIYFFRNKEGIYDTTFFYFQIDY